MGVAAQAMQQAGLHANHVIHPEMTGFPQVITDSSLHRQQRGDAMLNGLRTDPLTILADQSNAEFPIYRNAAQDSDTENTMATADIHVGEENITAKVSPQPGEHATFNLDDATRF